MAALIPEARRARDHAGRLRIETMELNRSLRASTARSREQLREAEAALERVRVRRRDPLPSPWSTLCWTYGDEDVDHALVPLH